MRADVTRDMSDSTYDFVRVVWPAIRSKLGGGDVMPVETIDDQEMARALDILGGVDAWHIMGSGMGIRGIASRVQWGQTWETFTLRERRPNGAKTELAKRLESRSRTDGRLYPYITVHAYVEEPRRRGRLLRANIARTDDLIEFVVTNYQRVDYGSRALGVWRQTNPKDGVDFICVSCSAMTRAGLEVKVVKYPQEVS